MSSLAEKIRNSRHLYIVSSAQWRETKGSITRPTKKEGITLTTIKDNDIYIRFRKNKIFCGIFTGSSSSWYDDSTGKGEETYYMTPVNDFNLLFKLCFYYNKKVYETIKLALVSKKIIKY